MSEKTKRRMHISHLFLRLLWTGQLKEKECSHRHLIQNVTPSADVCEECVKLGDTWPQLRICLICGYVGCCDTSKNKHARKHFEETGHPIIKPFKSGGDWMWCYVDSALLSP